MIEVIEKNASELEIALEMSDITLQTEINFDRGDIDVLAKGTCWYTGEITQAVVEVKGHSGLVHHYKRWQLPKYKQQYPKAKQYVCYGANKSLNFQDFCFLSEEVLN